jgi:GH15 family glucan-1,4-alpha-glucosidase
MSRRIEEYALIGDLHTAALVAADGSVDWLCLPRFDSAACFAGLLGEERHGHWRIAPAGDGARVSRRYLPDTLVLQTEFATGSGVVTLTDCMPPRGRDPVLVRMLEGVSGSVEMRMTFGARFEYGSAWPDVRRQDGAQCVRAGSQALWLFGPVHLRSRGGQVVAQFRVRQGDRVPLAAVWRLAGAAAPDPPLVPGLIEDTARWWAGWTGGLDRGGEWRDAVTRSLITIKALTFAPTGGLLAAPTAALPQQACGARNWDYRYCWLRDAAAALPVLLGSGALADAGALLRFVSHAVAGQPGQIQDLYGLDGRRWLPEIELGWLPGYEGAQPVRIGNAACAQHPLAAIGDVLTTRLTARLAGMAGPVGPWDPAEVLSLLESGWREPDAGNWEIRGPPRQFVHSKVMMWAAADAAVKMIERFGDAGPAGRWRKLRGDIRADVLGHGYQAGPAAFVQHYSGTALDASALRFAPLGFLPAGDQRIRATAAAVERELGTGGGVLARYQQEPGDSLDGLPPGAGGYLPATCWLAQCYALAGQPARARAAFGRLLDLRNDVGLLAEEYDPLRGRLAGNFPLAASHAAAAATAALLDAEGGEPGLPPGPPPDGRSKAPLPRRRERGPCPPGAPLGGQAQTGCRRLPTDSSDQMMNTSMAITMIDQIG